MLPFPTIVIEKTVLTVLLGITLVILVAMTAIFRYHWKRFGLEARAVSRMRQWYGIISTMLCVGALALYALNIFLL
ncbi:MAG: hypothetical protein Q7R64_01810 [bacterium]|nr:hypothetical protein [bacterium]